MSDPENEHLIAWTKMVLICGGFWDRPVSDNPFLEKAFKVYSVFMRTSYIVFWLLLVGELIRLMVNDYELAVIASSLSVVVNATKITAKLIIYTKYNVLGMFGDVIEKERAVWQSNDEEIEALYKRKVRVSKLFVIALAGTTGVAIGLLQISGVLGAYRLIEFNQMHNVTIEPHMMYKTILPLNKLGHLKSWFASQALWAWTGFINNSLTHLIFVNLLVYVASQLEILQVKFRNCFGPNTDDKISLLKELVIEHRYIIGYVRHFNNCTKYIIMMEFILSSLDIASVAINLIKLDTSELGWLVFFFILLTIQIFLIAWTCNEIKIQSQAIGDALYESKWYLLDKDAARLIQIVIARAQRPLTMTIGPFGPMTTQSALLVVKGAYSYVSIMKK